LRVVGIYQPSYGRAIASDLPPILLAVRHIGPRRARRLLDALGPEWRELLDLAPVRVFATLRGMGAARARAAADSWRALSAAQRDARHGPLPGPVQQPRRQGGQPERP
jgi:hypothetical protein